MTRTVLALLLLAACSTAPAFTVGDLCAELGAATCTRAYACGTLSVPADACLSTFVADCCAGDCEGAADEAAADTCTTDIIAEDCAPLSTGMLPASCGGL